MPKLVYFDIQGKAQSIRYLLGYKGVEFEDIRLTPEQWGEAKAAGTYTPVGGQMPAWVEDDGTKRNQTNAILQYLAMKHGCAP